MRRLSARRRLHSLLVALALAALLALACDDEPAPEAAVPAGASVVSIPARDGARLDGRLFEASSERIVLLLHMYTGDQADWWETARELQQRGTSALTFDFRGYGASSGEKGEAIDDDVRAAVEWARARGYERIALVGASMGGTAAIAVADDERVDGVVAISAPEEFLGIDAETAIGEEPDTPVALVAAEGDVSAAHSLEALAERGDLPHERVMVTPGRWHGTDLLDSPEGERVSEFVYKFLDAEIGADPD